MYSISRSNSNLTDPRNRSLALGSRGLEANLESEDALTSLDGLLPSGDFEGSFEELRESILVLGPGDSARYPTWDHAWRLHLVDNLEILTRQLWQVGIRDIYADDSFSEDKDHPMTSAVISCVIFSSSAAAN